MNDLAITSQIDLAVQQQEKAKSLSAAPISLAKQGASLEQIEESAQEFEAMFLSEMLKPMFEGVMEPDSVFGGGKGEEVFSGMMLQEYGKLIAQRGGVGLADQVKAEMIRLQEQAGQTVQ